MSSLLFSSLNLNEDTARILLASVCKSYTRDQESLFFNTSLPLDVGECYETNKVENNNQLPIFSTRKSALFPITDSLIALDNRFSAYFHRYCTISNINTSISVFERLALKGLAKRTAYYQIRNKSFNTLPIAYHVGFFLSKREERFQFHSVPRRYNLVRLTQAYNLPFNQKHRNWMHYRRLTIRFSHFFNNNVMFKFYGRKTIFSYLSKKLKNFVVKFKKRKKSSKRLKLISKVLSLGLRTRNISHHLWFEDIRRRWMYTSTFDKCFSFLHPNRNLALFSTFWDLEELKVAPMRTFAHAYKCTLKNKPFIRGTNRLPFMFPFNYKCTSAFRRVLFNMYKRKKRTPKLFLDMTN